MERTIGDQKSDKTFIKRNRWLLFPIAHFLLSFLWEDQIFLKGHFDEYDTTMVRDSSVISDSAEHLLVYLLSRAFCFVIIWLLWKLIFYLVRRQATRSEVVIFGGILIAGMLVGLLLYPDSFGIEMDNFSNFLRITRFQPSYWQSVYTGALYGGCLMVIPHPIALSVFQWMFFWFTVSYIVTGVKRKFGNKWYAYLPLLFFILPESYYLSYNAYRNNFYAVLIMFYIAYLFFHCTGKDKAVPVTVITIIQFAVLSAFIMVWRSEGALIGIGGLIIYFIYVITPKKVNVKQIVVLACSIVVAFALLNGIQGIGAKKYYGQDYMIINTTNVLYNVFNDPDVDLSYNGAKSDLQDIEAVTPVEVLKEQGMKGYRNYNWTSGRKSFNQTLATDDVASAYMSAYYSIIMHNARPFLNVQINKFCKSIGLPETRPTYEFTGEPQVDLDSFVYDKWKIGQKEVLHTWKTAGWEKNPQRQKISAKISGWIAGWRDFLTDTHLNPYLHVIVILLDGLVLLYLLLTLLLHLIRRRGGRRGTFGFALAFLVIIGEMAAILLFMPEGRATYMYPTLYASYLCIYFFGIFRFRRSE